MNRRPSPSEWLATADRLALNRRGSELVGPCPACGGTDRFHVHWRGPRAGQFACRQCGGFKTILEAAKLWQPAQGREKPVQRRYDPPPRNHPARTATARERLRDGEIPTTDRSEVSRDTRAGRLWARTSPDPGPVGRYLAGRGVWPPGAPLPETVRWLPGPELQAIPWREPPGPDAAGAMACAFTNPAGEVRAVSLEALTAHGKRTGERWRRTIGKPAGSRFRVRGPGDLALCEGEADALALHTWTGCEAWAAGGTSGMSALAGAVVADGRAVTVHCDGDGPGRIAAAALQDTALAQGGRVRLAFTAAGSDPADVLTELWRERVAIMQAEACMSRPEAEAAAWADIMERPRCGRD